MSASGYWRVHEVQFGTAGHRADLVRAIRICRRLTPANVRTLIRFERLKAEEQAGNCSTHAWHEQEEP
jgi:hypothetical protein